MKNFPIMLFVAYQTSLLILESNGIVKFNYAYSLVSLALLGYACYQAYLKSKEIPQLSNEFEKLLESRDADIKDLKSEMGKYAMSKTSNQPNQFRF